MLQKQRKSIKKMVPAVAAGVRKELAAGVIFPVKRSQSGKREWAVDVTVRQWKLSWKRKKLQ